MGRPVKAHEAQIAWTTLEAPWPAPPMTNPASVPPFRNSKEQVRHRNSSSAPPPTVYRGPGAVYRAGAAVSRPAAGFACSRSAGAAYRAGAAVYRDQVCFFICVALGFRYHLHSGRICVRI
jgi:hypothetical protein